MATDPTKSATAAELADALFTMMPMVAEHVDTRLAEFGMTTTDYWALRSVEGPMAMKDLATCMEIDPSYVTVVADRLEELGFIKRQPHPTDRRVKNLVLTTKGERFKETILDEIWTGNHIFTVLSKQERAAVIEIAYKVVAASSVSSSASPA